ncbi:MAG: hypothetical protein EP318_05660 [Rhodobacteraceae bacterium]|nr:MAG: hypothetical protein EP318_05660 [Paracoccaceae bacterium]
MKIVLHAGAHATDDDRLLRCLLRNADDLRDKGVAIPGPSRYRQLLSGALSALSKADPAPEARDILLESVLSEDHSHFDRLVLSHEHMFCVPKIALGAGRIYPRAEERLANAARLFRDDEIALFLGIRNPATWLPAVFAQTPHRAFDLFLNGADPAWLRWSELIERIRRTLPDLPITVWCNEDSPLIWGEIVRAMAGLPSGTRITGAFDLLARIMTKEGMVRFRAYLKAHPGLAEPQKRRVMIAFLDKYALDEAVEEELDIPGWTEDYVAGLSEMYERDVDAIAGIDRVTLISA